MWLGINITKTEISPLEPNTSALFALKSPNTLKKSFLGSVRYIIKFIPNLAIICQPLRPLLQKSIKLIGTEKHIIHFNTIKTLIAKQTENNHHNPQFETSVTILALETLTVYDWKPTPPASRFFKTFEKAYIMISWKYSEYFDPINIFKISSMRNDIQL